MKNYFDKKYALKKIASHMIPLIRKKRKPMMPNLFNQLITSQTFALILILHFHQICYRPHQVIL